jgi:hypothetical protein
MHVLDSLDACGTKVEGQNCVPENTLQRLRSKVQVIIIEPSSTALLNGLNTSMYA